MILSKDRHLEIIVSSYSWGLKTGCFDHFFTPKMVREIFPETTMLVFWFDIWAVALSRMSSGHPETAWMLGWLFMCSEGFQWSEK